MLLLEVEASAAVGAAPKPVFTVKDTETVTPPTSDAAESPSRDASRASSSGSSAGHESVRTIDSHNMASGLQYHSEAAKPSAPQPLSFDERLHEHSTSTTGNGHAPAAHLTGKLSFRALDRVKSGHQLMHQCVASTIYCIRSYWSAGKMARATILIALQTTSEWHCPL